MKADFDKILREAYRITFKNKWLWVFGLVLAITSSSSSGNFNFPNGTNRHKNQNMNTIPDYNNKIKVPTLNQPTETFNTVGKVLSESTISAKDVFSKVPIYYWVLLGLFFLIFMLFAIVLTIYARSWAQGSIIYGIDLENKNTFISLSDSSKYGRKKAFEILKINLIPMLLLFLIFCGAGTPFVLGTVFLTGIARVFLILVGVILLLVLFVAMIFVSVSSFLGTIALTLEDLTWKRGFKKGFTVFKRYFLDVIVMGLINCFVSCAVSVASCVLLIPVGFIAFLGFLGVAAIPVLAVIAVPIGVLLFIALIIGLSLIKAVFQVFSSATWVLLYKDLMREVPSGK